ncbi:hypothetical protein GMOD_00006403 [Pyrenophora seminiperda CCB06]|uniref:Uncharacterized protein n=1 Tax=Pyrenophora seminiperda CCB06 TaxID=1302712 RepID=A0A3M7M507_9PLEO|nr:hypothetical protein GMOD_00006403 [Pyrenophora seminiperda CCB06]
MKSTMAMQSTKRSQLYSTLVPNTLSAYFQNTQSTMSTPSLLYPKDTTLSLSLTAGEHHQEHVRLPLPATYAPTPGYGHDPTLTDGEESWFCARCGDGPYGSWQVSCQNCSTHR